MDSAPWIALIGTLDTKGEEIAYVRDRLRALGARPLVIDTGILGEPQGCEPDIPHAEVAAAAGDDLEGVRVAGSRGAAVERMLAGVRAVCLRLYREGRLDGALCLGGAEGGLMGAAAMHALPVGVPKLIVTPSASGPPRVRARSWARRTRWSCTPWSTSSACTRSRARSSTTPRPRSSAWRATAAARSATSASARWA